MPNGKISKVSTDENLSTDNESDSGAMDTESSDDDGPIVLADKKDSELIDLFQKLYSHFDEDDVELCNNILNLLTVLKEKGCVTEQEYTAIKSRLEKMIQLNSYESIDSTVENMTRDDKNEILGLLRWMENDELVAELLGLVKDYFENEMDLESVQLLLPRLKNKVDALKVKIILNQIKNTRNRVNKIFTKRADMSDKNDSLKDLRASIHISDEQHAKQKA